jgi:hypothetical protein
MGIRLAAGNGAKIGIKPNLTGRLYGAGYLYLAEMSGESGLEFANSVTTQEVYATTTAKNIGGVDAASFNFTAFVSDTTGMVYRYVVSAPGSEYTTAPTLAIAAPPSGGVQATAIAEVDSALGTVVGAWPLVFGEGYITAPAVTPSGGGGTGATFTSHFGGLTDYVFDEMLRNLYMKIEFSPAGGTTSSKKTRYTFDFTRENYSVSPAVNGVISISASGKAENITKDTW